MAAPAQLDRYTDRKTHDCGCITVWDDMAGPRYLAACGVHRGHAQQFQASDEASQLLDKPPHLR